MKLNLITLNVRGLNDPAKITRLRNYLQGLQPILDIIMIQEHKLKLTKAEGLGSSLMINFGYFYMDAIRGYGHGANEAGAGCGGQAIPVSSRIMPHVVSSGSLCQGRILWINLTNIPGGEMGVATVYSPNEAADRRALWDRLPQALPPFSR